MEDLTLAIVTLTSFVLLFVVAIFADKAGAELELDAAANEPAAAPVMAETVVPLPDADVA